MAPGHPLGLVYRPIPGFVLVLCLVLVAQARDVGQLRLLACTYLSQNAAPLSPGSTIDSELVGGESHEYSLTLLADDFVRVIVEQRGIDIVLALRAPDGKQLAEVDGPLGVPNQKSLSLVAEFAGEYRLTVRPSSKNAARAPYVLKVGEWRQAGTKDRSIAAGERAFAEAERQNRQNRAETTRHAIEKYAEALGYWRVAEDRLAEAFTLLRKGLAHHNVSQFKEAVDCYTQALPIWENLGNERAVAQVLTNMGWSYHGLGQLQRALDVYTRALEIRRSLNDQRGTAQTLNLVADALGALGDPNQGIARYLEAVKLAQAAADQGIEAYALNGLGWLHFQIGEYDAALELVDRALPVWQKIGNGRGEAYSLNLRAAIYAHWLYVDEAEISYRNARTILRELGDRFGEAQGLNNLGILYYYIADNGRAKESYTEALAIWESIGNRLEESRTLNNLALISWKAGSLRESLDYSSRALALSHAAGYRDGEATSLHNMGIVHSDLGDTQRAFDYCEKALKLYREIGDNYGEETTLHDLAFFYESQGDVQRAFDLYSQSVGKNGFLVAQMGLARIELKRGDLLAARSHIEAVIKEREVRRAKIPDEEMRITYEAAIGSAYELQAEILMRLDERAVVSNQPSEDYLAAALETSEHARARSLLDTLAETRADIRNGVEPALLKDETSLREKIDAGEMRRQELLNSRGHEKRLAELEKENEELERRFNDVRARIRTTSPRYAALTQPEPLSLREIQGLLDDNTILLEFFVGKNRSFLWSVTPHSLKGYFLPARSEIEKHARHMYALLSDSDHLPSLESTPAARAQEVEYKEEAETLSRMLLGPVATQLGNKRVVIVSDGVLQYVPFGALPTPAMDLSQTNANAPGTAPESKQRIASPSVHPLIRDHEIVNLPSASVLGVLRRELTGRPSAPKTLAVLADPVFSADDSRAIASRTAADKMLMASSSTVKPPRSGPDVERSAGDTGINDFVRLRFSRQEAEMITAFLPEKDRLRALDFSASRATAVSSDLSQYRILHFATHGLLNSKHPQLSGLVLSLVNEHGEPLDGFLRYHEIYNLKLNADLVVLSACQTALGKEVLGEGLIGLTRGFMYAGAPRVVASLWRVDDRATAELMKQFYRGMLNEGLRPAAALRAAQVSILSDRRWSAPYYWAAFTLQGDWR